MKDVLPFIAEFASGGFAGELPVDFDPVAIHPAVPSVSFPPQHLEGRNSSFAEALPEKRSISI